MLERRERDYWPDPPRRNPVAGLELIAMENEHIDTVLEIEIASFPTPWTRDAFEYDINKNHLGHYWVLTKDDEIIGYIGIWLVGDIAHVTNICIREDFRGNKLGRWLLLTVMNLGAELGARRFTLEVRETNHSAIGLYESIGFRAVGRKTNYYQEIGEDALVMWTGKPPFEES